MTGIHVADTGLFVAMGDPDNERYRAVRRFARRNDVVFVLPERVYEELTDPPAGSDPPVDAAIAEGWARVETLDYSIPLVSRVMDGVQRYVASAEDRRPDAVERADAALAGVAAQALVTGEASEAYVYTTDVAAGEGAETVLGSEGYADAVTFVDGFRFVEDRLD